MIPAKYLTALVSLALFCTIASAAPEAKLQPDRVMTSGAEIAPNQWFDVLLRVDPKGEAILAKGLAARLDPVADVETDQPLYPAPDAEGRFTGPFVVRLPVRIVKMKKSVELRATLTGTDANGGKVELDAKAKVLLHQAPMRHVSATASLKEPAVAGRPNAIVVDASVIEPYHVYGKKVDIGIALVAELLGAPGATGALPWTGGGPVSPPGEKYYGDFSFEIPFTPTREGELGLRVMLDWQACTEFICDANEFLYVPFSFQVAPGSGDTAAPPAPVETGQDTTSSSGLEGKSLWQLILLAIGAGIFALLMPCTYPLIPITISFFSKQAEAREGKVAGLAFAYGGGIVGIFTAIGLLVGVGVAKADAFSDLSTNTWMNLVFAGLFLLFGLSLVGLFDIRLPSWFDNVAQKATGSGGYLSVFAMGATLVITSFTCTAPFIGTLLVFASQGGDLGGAVLAMAVFGLTMAIPFVILSLSPKAMHALPRSGEWMKRLKVTLGIIELGLVLKFLSNVDISLGWFLVGRELFLVLWSVSFLAAGLYLLGFFDLFARGARWSVTKGRGVVGVALLGLAGVLCYGATGPRLGKYVEAFLPAFERLYSDGFVAVFDDYEEGVKFAREHDANIFLHFTGYS